MTRKTIYNSMQYYIYIAKNTFGITNSTEQNAS